MPIQIDRQVAEEVARRAARRLAILGRERPDLLAERFADLDDHTLTELMALTRLPEPLADREPRRRHRGVEGVDYCTSRLVASRRLPHDADISQLDDEDLLAARRYLPETLPGNVLG